MHGPQVVTHPHQQLKFNKLEFPAELFILHIDYSWQCAWHKLCARIYQITISNGLYASREEDVLLGAQVYDPGIWHQKQIPTRRGSHSCLFQGKKYKLQVYAQVYDPGIWHQKQGPSNQIPTWWGGYTWLFQGKKYKFCINPVCNK